MLKHFSSYLPIFRKFCYSFVFLFAFLGVFYFILVFKGSFALFQDLINRVLTLGQMSFWEATVITSLASAIPVVGVGLLMTDFLPLERTKDNTIRQFRKDNYPLIGMGAAIIAAFLALAGAAWSLDLPYFLSFNLFCSVYWFFIYLSIYIDILWGVYERTKDMVKRAFTQKRQALIFFLQMGFLITSFVIFIFFYQLMFPEIEKGNLVNPLQVLAQLSCLLFNFRYPFKPVRVRHLLLLCFFLSLTSSLYLKGIKWEIISLLFFFLSYKYSSISFRLCPQNYVFRILP